MAEPSTWAAADVSVGFLRLTRDKGQRRETVSESESEQSESECQSQSQV